MNDFLKGLLIGLCAGLLLCAGTSVLVNRHYKERELIEYAEKQTEVQRLREDYSNRPAVEFLADPGVRGAVDGAAGTFERKRDDLLQRFRSGIAD